MVKKFICSENNGKYYIDWGENTLVDALAYHRHRTPDHEVYKFLGDGENETDSTTFSQLQDFSFRLGAWLKRVLRSGSRVILLYDSSLDYIRGIMGCMTAGMVPVSGVYPRSYNVLERFAHVQKDSQAVAVIGPKVILSEFQKHFTGKMLGAGFLWIPTDVIPATYTLVTPDRKKDDIALIQYTSGSTSNPKGVVLTHRNLSHNIALQVTAFSFTRADLCGVNWLPLTHDMGLIGGALIILAVGAQCVLLPPEKVLEKPVRWLSAISKYQASISGGPNFIYDACISRISAEEAAGLSLSRWQLASNGAEYISRSTMDKFAQHFAVAGFKKTAFSSCYGLAEATLMATAGERGQGITFGSFSRSNLSLGVVAPPQNTLDERLIASCGRVAEAGSVAITRPESGEMLPPGQVGEICLHSLSVSPGYVSQFPAGVINTGKGDRGHYLQTGDRGFLFEDQLYVVGRFDNRIEISQQVFDVEDIISALGLADPDVTLSNTIVFDQIVHGGDQELFVIVENTADDNDALRARAGALAQIIFRTWRVNLCTVAFVRKGNLMKTSSGKIRMRLSQEMFLDKKFTILFEKKFDKASFRTVSILKEETASHH